MAEALGVGASVAGLVTIADSVVRKGFKFIKDVKDAEKSVEKLVVEINNLSGVLHCLNNVVEQLEEDGANVDPSTQIHYIESCYKTLMKVQGYFDETVPVTPMSRGDRLRWPLKKSHTKELLIEIERHKATMTLAMTAREMSTLLEILARQDGIREGIQDIKFGLDADRAERQNIVITEVRRKMLNLLGDVDARKWQETNIRVRQPGTGVWFTDGPEFQNWLSTDKSKLWINGIPGAGKTILISSIIQDIKRQVKNSHALAYFYCDYKDPRTHNPLNILGALARQLILRDERCFAQLSEFAQDHTMSDSSTFSHTPGEICDLIREVSKNFQTTMIIVDGLDEITDNRADVTRLLRSLNTENGRIKTLFASRPEVDIGYELEDFIQIPIAAMSSDLRLYVASEIERRTSERKLRIRDPSLKDHIMTTLVDGAYGMFRWVACQLDYLSECSNDRDRREALKKLPPDLPSSYERILERVNRSSKENQDMVVKTLHWIIYAVDDEDTFNTKELLQALAVRDGERSFDGSAMPTEEDVLHWCSSLIRRNATSPRLELAHFTVKEFLDAIDPVQTPSFQPYRLYDDHTVLAKTCLNFLHCREFDGSSRPKTKYDDENWQETWYKFQHKYTFIKYASVNWSHHVHNSRWANVENEVWDIFNTEDTFTFWTLGYLLYGEYGRINVSHYFGKPLSPTRLHWAALFALDKICTIFIEGGMNVYQQSCMGTPLYCALLSHGAICNFTDIDISTRRTLHQPSARETVIRQLVGAGANLDVGIDPEGQHRALEIAFLMEKFHIPRVPFLVSTLLDLGARISAEDFDILDQGLDSFYNLTGGQIGSLPDPWFCGISPSLLIKTVVREKCKNLLPGAESQFFRFILILASRGLPIESMQSFFEIKFSELFPELNGSELDIILNDESKARQERLVIVLSKAIRNTSHTAEQAALSLQTSLYYAVYDRRALIVSLLFEHNHDLDANYEYSGQEEKTLLNELMIFFDDGIAEDMLTLQSLLFHGANVLVPNLRGVTCIEYAASKYNLAIFQLFWDSAMRFKIFETSPEILERVLSRAVSARNQPVIEYIEEKLSDSRIRPKQTSLSQHLTQKDAPLPFGYLDRAASIHYSNDCNPSPNANQPVGSD